MKSVITFLKKLKKNNDREWFNSNKAEYEKAREDFTMFTTELINGITAFDPLMAGTDPKKCLFRIYRDIRFSKDKSPYKTAFGASICPGGRKSGVAGYYMHLAPGNSFLAGGKYRPDSSELLKIRNAIAAKPKEFLAIGKNGKFKEYFGEIRGDKLKTTPKGFPKDHKMIEHLRLKGFIAYNENVSDRQAASDEFADYALEIFKAMKPLIDFLRKALDKK